MRQANVCIVGRVRCDARFIHMLRKFRRDKYLSIKLATIKETKEIQVN